MPTANATPETKPTAEQVMANIRQERAAMDTSEGEVINRIVKIGLLFGDLKKAAGRGNWEAKVKELDYDPRVARRYQKIAKAWGKDEFGLLESDLLAKLPADLIKLELLCKLPKDKLTELVKNLDCKHKKRTEVADAVREALGKDKRTPKKQADLKTFVDAFFDALVERAKEKQKSKLGALKAAEKSLSQVLKDVRKKIREETVTSK